MFRSQLSYELCNLNTVINRTYNCGLKSYIIGVLEPKCKATNSFHSFTTEAQGRQNVRGKVTQLNVTARDTFHGLIKIDAIYVLIIDYSERFFI